MICDIFDDVLEPHIAEYIQNEINLLLATDTASD